MNEKTRLRLNHESFVVGYSILGLLLVAGTHLFSYVYSRGSWDGHGDYLYHALHLEWDICPVTLLLGYALGVIGLLSGVTQVCGLNAFGERTKRGVLAIVIALSLIAMEVALHTLPARPVYAA